MARRTLPYANPERYPNSGAKEQSTQIQNHGIPRPGSCRPRAWRQNAGGAKGGGREQPAQSDKHDGS